VTPPDDKAEKRSAEEAGRRPDHDAHPEHAEPPTGAPTCRVALFAPSPILTITIENGPNDEPEVHVHAGGQGFWVARMAVSLGAEVTFCAPFGGEPGHVLEALIEDARLSVRAVPANSPNAAYVHDRRGGERETIVEAPSPQLNRHEVDELYGAAVAAALEADVTLLTGPRDPDLLPADVYRRLATDLAQNDVRVVADLTGPPLEAALEGGIDLLKVNLEELGKATDGRPVKEEKKVAERMRQLQESGAKNVLVSRSEDPALALVGDRVLTVSGPQFDALDPLGAGDSMFAGAAVGLGSDADIEHALRLAARARTSSGSSSTSRCESSTAARQPPRE
jgi:1-phosphofructokinase